MPEPYPVGVLLPGVLTLPVFWLTALGKTLLEPLPEPVAFTAPVLAVVEVFALMPGLAASGDPVEVVPLVTGLAVPVPSFIGCPLALALLTAVPGVAPAVLPLAKPLALPLPPLAVLPPGTELALFAAPEVDELLALVDELFALVELFPAVDGLLSELCGLPLDAALPRPELVPVPEPAAPFPLPVAEVCPLDAVPAELEPLLLAEEPLLPLPPLLALPPEPPPCPPPPPPPPPAAPAA